MPKNLPQNTDRNKLFKVYGLLLEEILNIHNVYKPRNKDKNKLHRAFKESKGIKTLTSLSNASLSAYIDEIKGFFAIEMGIYLRSANEPEDASSLTLSEYFKKMNKIQKQMIFDKLETLYNFHSYKERTRFLCDLTDTPLTSVVGNEDRLMEEVRNWINNN